MKLLSRIRLTIGAKLVGLIGTLLILSVVTIVWQSVRLFTEDNKALIQQVNADTVSVLGTQMRALFESTTDKMRSLGTVLIQEIPDAQSRDRIVKEFFQDKDFLAVFVHRHSANGAAIQYRATSADMEGVNDKDGAKALEALAEDKSFSLAQIAKGEIQLTSVKLADGSQALAIALPFIQVEEGRFSHTIVAFVRQGKFVKAFSEIDSVTSYMVDRNGRLLAHPDAERAASGESVAHVEIVRLLLEGKFNNQQMRYFDGEWRLGAFRVVGFAGLGVVAEVPEAKAFEASYKVRYRSMLIALIILSVSFFVGYLYSGTITWPIKQLVVAAGRISAGDFKIDLKPKGNDEVAHLSGAFNEMAKGLEERDRVKDTFNKFHNKEIAEKLLSGEVKLGGERKEATIFFSDVRGFTGMSETMQPEQVVEMLNEYMERMVSIIRQHNGIVDKYVGDAIMALWGVPLEKPDDTYNALKACVAMRTELAKLNELRISRGQPPLRIGMGLNRGSVIAGNIGSSEKMEYTVIGDTVNTASRMESMTKEYGTDLLVPRKVAEEVRDRFIFEQAKSAKVKGKTEAIEIYKVLGYFDEAGEPVVVETPYSSYASEKSDKVVHDEAPKPEAAAPAAEPAPASEAGPATGPAPVVAQAPVIEQPPVAEAPQPAAQTAKAETAAATGTIAQLIDDLPVPNPFAKAPPPAPTVEWFISLENEAYGPFTVAEIRDGISRRELIGTMMATTEPKTGHWAPLEKCPDFQEQFQSLETHAA